MEMYVNVCEYLYTYIYTYTYKLYNDRTIVVMDMVNQLDYIDRYLQRKHVYGQEQRLGWKIIDYDMVMGARMISFGVRMINFRARMIKFMARVSRFRVAKFSKIKIYHYNKISNAKTLYNKIQK